MIPNASCLCVLALFTTRILATIQLTVPPSAWNQVILGRPFNISWTGALGPVTLTLKNDTVSMADTLPTVSIIAAGQTGTNYTWDVPRYGTAYTDRPSDTFIVEATDGIGVDSTLRFQFLTSSSRSTSTTTPASSTSSLSSQTSSSSATQTSSSPSSDHTSLSSGAKAGIGVGAALGSLILVGLLGLFFYFGKRAASRKAVPETNGTTIEKAELGTDGLRETATAAELDGRARAELEDNRKIGRQVVEIGES